MTRAVMVWSEGEHLKLVEVWESATTMIGRAPGSAVALRDSTVSWRHAQLTTEEGAFHIESLSRTTNVNNEAIEGRVRLLDGAVVDVGRVRLFFCDLAAAHRPSGPVCRRCSRENLTTARHCWSCGNSLVRVRTKTPRRRRACDCRFVSADGAFYDIHGGDAFVIDLEGESKTLRSRDLPANVAAIVHLRKGKPSLLSLESDVPVTLNGEAPSQEYVLRTGDEIRVGKRHFIVVVR